MMPSIFDFPYLKYYLFAVLISIVFYFITKIFIKTTEIEISNFIRYLLFPLSIMVLGLTMGLLSGNNREVILDVVVSGVLTLLAGLLSFAFVKSVSSEESKLKKHHPRSNNISTISIIVCFLSISIMYGSNIGSKIRVLNEQIGKTLEFDYLEKELRIRNKYMNVSNYKIDSIITKSTKND